MPAIDADHHWPQCKQGRERNEPAVLIRQVEFRHQFAKPGANPPLIDHIQPLNKIVIRFGEFGTPITAVLTICR